MSEFKAPEIPLEYRRSVHQPFEKISSADLFGKAYVLLAASEGQRWCEAAETVRGRLAGVSLDVYRIGSKGLRDPEARFGAAYGVGTAGAVLVRPDGIVAWKADSAEGDPESALAEAFSRIIGLTPPADAGNGPTPVRSATPVVSMKVPTPAEAKKTPESKPGRAPTSDTAAAGFYNPYAMPRPSMAHATLYMHPLSMFSRPIRLFIAESGLDIRQQVVDLAKGEHHGEEYTRKNPSQLVPILEDGDFRLTESAAILKYIADKTNSPAYPSDPVRRAKIDEMMDWLNTQFYRDWGFNLCLPQIFPSHRRRSEEAQAGAIEWGQQNSRRWLQVLNDHWIGKDEYLVGNRLSIADFFGVALVTLGEIIHTDFGKYPNVARWIENMKRLKSWESVNETFSGFVSSTKGKPFHTV